MRKIDGNIGFNNSGFEFNNEMTNIFNNHVVKSIPCYNEVHNIIAWLSDWFVQENTNIYDVGTSTGKCISSINARHFDKNMNFIGIDKSSEMIKKAKEENLGSGITFINDDILNNELVFENASIITSILTLQFVPIQNRQEVINKIYKGLNKGGAFIFFEKIEVDDSMLNRIYSDIYNDFKTISGFSTEEIMNKSKSIRGVMRPLSMADNIKIFKNAGFDNADIFFKWCNFVGFILIK